MTQVRRLPDWAATGVAETNTMPFWRVSVTFTLMALTSSPMR
jgi:hypothetical protein